MRRTPPFFLHHQYMRTNKIHNLRDAGIFQYGSDELTTFEKRLTRYFAREYKRHKNSQKRAVVMDYGPLALAPDCLAEQHYDQGLEFFRTFLDHETMSYTMAFFDETPEKAVASKLSLAEAQARKFNLIAQRMQLTGDEQLLNIGCGFGYFESFLLDTYKNLRISATTQSKEQYDFMLNRTKDPSDILSSERFRLFFGNVDASSPDLWGRKKYQLVFSVGLLEQINNIGLLFEIINELLAENGSMFHHLIVSRDLIPQFMDPDKTLIGKYFPGGKVLPFSALQYNPKGFILKDAWFINGMNYWKTLDGWHSNFWNNLHQIYPDKIDLESVRHWNNYFVLCKAMFWPENGLAYGNGQYRFCKTA